MRFMSHALSPAEQAKKLCRDTATIQLQPMEVQTVLAIGFPPLIAICRNVQVNSRTMEAARHTKTNKPVSVNGGWSEFVVQKPCSVTCGKGQRILKRTCTNPSPAFGGTECMGSALSTRECQTEQCPSQNTQQEQMLSVTFPCFSPLRSSWKLVKL